MRLPPRGYLTVCVLAGIAAVAVAPSQASDSRQAPTNPKALWIDATAVTIGTTAQWTNKVEIADIDGDGRLDLLFANGGDYSTPGKPELNRAFLNRGAGVMFEEQSTEVFGTPDLTRVIKARDLNGDGFVDILSGNTYQTQSRLYLGTGKGVFREVTATHLPPTPLSVGDLEFGDVDADGDLDAVIADWGAGNNMTNDGGRTRLWLNDGAGRFTDASSRLPGVLVRFSWDLELADAENDGDLDVLVSCKRCTGGYFFRNDGTGNFTDDPRALPQYTNNYEYELMDLDGDGFLDIVTMNDGEIVREQGSNRREHVFRNDGKGRFRDATAQWWPPDQNIGEDDNMVAFLDYDSDGDADFVIGSLTGPDRLVINDGKGHLRVATDVFTGDPTPGTLGLALGDLDADGRLDVVQAQGEHPTAVQERVFFGRGLAADTAKPSVTLLPPLKRPDGRVLIRARVHDRKSPSLPAEWKSIDLETELKGMDLKTGVVSDHTLRLKMRWAGEYVWTAEIAPSGRQRVCATDAAGNTACSDWLGGS
jgi:hypothetical protein